MTIVEMYSTSICPWCVRAKRLLAAKGVGGEQITEINVDFGREEMLERTGGHTVPQIVINGTVVGGYDDLAALDAAGKLEPLLAAAPTNEN